MNKFGVVILGILSAAAIHPAHAQKTSVVQCQTGTVVQIVPDYACDALMAAFPKMKKVDDMDACSEEMARRLGGNEVRFRDMCYKLYLRDLYNRQWMHQ